MKHTVKIFTLLVLLFVMAAGQVWSQGTTSRIITGTITEGCSLGYYSDQGCTEAVDVSNVSSGTTIFIKATPDDSHTVSAMTVTAEATVSSLVATARRRVSSGSVDLGEIIEITTISPGIFSFQMPADENMNVKVSATFPEKESITPVVSISGWTYGDAANAPSVSGNPGNGTVTYTYSDAQDGTYTSAVPTEAGTYWVKAAVAMTADYYAGESAPVSFTIARKTVVVTITGHHSTVGWDGEEHSVSGYDFSADANLYTESYFTFSGTALAIRTDVGTTVMGLTAAQFENLNANFDVTFNVTDGWLTVNPLVTFIANGHGVAPAAQHVDCGSTLAAPVAPIADGYTFGGWYTTAECTGDPYNFATAVNDNLTLYAKWTLTVYTITYMGVDNAIFESANPTSYTIESPAITLNNPTREGCVFVGWTGTGLSAPSREVTIASGSTGNRTYTANWTSTLYCLVYNETTQTFDVFSPEEFTDVTSSTTTMSEGWYAVTENVTITGRVEVTGNVHLILCDGKTLSVTQGFHVKNPATFNVYAQNEGTGVLAATSAVAVNSDTNYHRAGIGTNGNNGVREVCGDITIHGGTVTAIGGRTAAGIGGGHRGTIGKITIRGGHVTAIGFDCSSGIGSGKDDEGASSAQSTYKGTVIITGGTVESRGTVQAIGAGYHSPSTNLQLGNMRVYASADATNPVPFANRESTCRSTYAKLTPCTEHNYSDGVCTWCGAKRQLILANNAYNGDAISQAAGDGMNYDVTLADRTLYRDGDWNTLCLPFDVDDFTGTPLEGATVKTLASTDFNDGTLTMNFSDNQTAIEAGKPYIVKWDGAILGADLIIRTAADWNTFSDNVKNGTTYAGKTVKLVTDITVSTMVGVESHEFQGTFDGCGHTLTVSLNGGACTAPFSYVGAATIRNLKVDGSVTTTGNKSSGLVGFTNGALTITNCVSSVTLSSSYNGNASEGGIMGLIDNNSGNVTIEDCAFKGKILTTNGTTDCGGIVGWRRPNGVTLTIKNCLYAPAALANGETEPTSGCKTFCRSDSPGPTITNCYYTRTLGGSQGTNASGMSNETLVSNLGNGWEVSGNNVVPKMVNTVNDIVNPVFTGVTISDASTNVNTVSTDYVDFVGTYSPVVIYEDGDKHNLYLGSGNDVYYPTREGYKVNACRAYFVLKNGLTAGAPTSPQQSTVRAFVLNFGEDSETGIRSLTPDPSPKGEGSSYWYSLDGRRLNGKPTASGIYINNGRKVVIK